jgi:hypothetical protein
LFDRVDQGWAKDVAEHQAPTDIGKCGQAQRWHENTPWHLSDAAHHDDREAQAGNDAGKEYGALAPGMQLGFRGLQPLRTKA